MPRRSSKSLYFVLEAINAFATAYYFNYLFFFMRDQFGFGNRENLLLAAVNGFVYMSGAWLAGRFAQKHGYLLALRLGVGGMAAALALASLAQSVSGQILTMVFWTAALCLTWPTLEALVSEGETRTGLGRRLGLYNVIWAGGTALAYFSGGALIQALGWASLYWLPAGLHVVQLALLNRLGTQRSTEPHSEFEANPSCLQAGVDPDHPVDPATAKSFLRMAWLANPFAYVAMNTALPLIPYLAHRLELSTMSAGFFCSIWFFARLGAFCALWRWKGWHYRFDWLVGSFVALVVSFAALLMANQLWVLILAQLLFGGAVGLIYYSSLFYAMDTSETKGVHGGVHEAAIGAGVFVGPALGAAALQFAPGFAHASAWAVSTLLLGGLGLLWWQRPGPLARPIPPPEGEVGEARL